MSDGVRLPLTAYPGMSRFVLDWLAGSGAARRFVPRDGGERPVRRWAPDASLVGALERSNREWGIDAEDALRRWSGGTTFTIVAGQQVGFAGGPLYTLAKLASVLRLKRDLEREGLDVTAFFWLATEDHDFDEVATFALPAGSVPPERRGEVRRDLVHRRARRRSDPRSVVGPLAVPESLTLDFLALLGLPRPRWLREGISFRDSFAELIAEAAGNDVVLVDALLPELRRCGAVLFDQIRLRSGEIQRTLHARGAELDAAGYAGQVVPRDGEEYTLLFELGADGTRRPSLAPAEPERTSTSAITRPLLQDFVLSPDVFVGGPAEVAYYAQVGALHELLGVTPPRVALRGHVLLAPARVLRGIARHGFGGDEVFAPADAVLAGREPEAVARIHETTGEARRDLERRIAEISALALPADHSLAGSFQRSIRHLEYHFGKLSERAVRAVARRDRERAAALAEAASVLHPCGKVQDRVVHWLPYWLASGGTLTQTLVEEIEPDSSFFRILAT